MEVTIEKGKYTYPRWNADDKCVETVVSIPKINIDKTKAEDFFRNYSNEFKNSIQLPDIPNDYYKTGIIDIKIMSNDDKYISKIKIKYLKVNIIISTK